jgi:integrase
MILRILFGCGTRLGETIELKRKDIDFKRGTLYLRVTKFSKERVIPMHKLLVEILERYCLALGIMSDPEAFLFPGYENGKHFSTREVDHWFSRILEAVNIDQRVKEDGERGACLHCFRHVFVLKSMNQLEKAGHPVDMNDLLLPTYLGHECMIDTDRYMRFSGVQSSETLDSFESFTSGLIPEVEVNYEEE